MYQTNVEFIGILINTGEKEEVSWAQFQFF